jgi:hypothetical protein
MAGRKSGVQARIKEIEPKALFNHCHGHLLNLACLCPTRWTVKADALLSIIENYAKH